MKLTYEESLKRFTETFSLSKKISDEAKEYIPGSYSRKTFNYGPHAIYADHADGAYIYTVEGRKLLDFNNNFTVSVLGYKNPDVDKAIIDTMATERLPPAGGKMSRKRQKGESVTEGD